MTATAQDRSKPVRLAMLMIGDGEWRGGLNYQRTLLQAISGPLAKRIEVRLFITEPQRDLAETTFGPWLAVPPIVDPRVTGAGTGKRALAALLSGHDRPFAELMQEHSIDVVFESARFFGRTFPLPAISWMPDFQHRELPHLFSRFGRLKRDIGFRAQAGSARRIILLSSETARKACEVYYPASLGRTQVVRFTPQLNAADICANTALIAAKYGLPEQFFYLPNQFWAHKNHGIVLDALVDLRAKGQIDALPPVIMSGPTSDYRNAGTYDRMMARAQSEAVLPWFRHLGLIPMEDVLGLNATATAVLNPSLFEGWASSVEEAKALGSPLILSDIPLHREQAPQAQFFNVSDPEALGNLLLQAARTPPPRQTDMENLGQENAARQSSFVAALEVAIWAAHNLGQGRRG